MTDNEREIMEHATAWRHPKNPLYRNYFAAGPEHEDWPALQALRSRGLMCVQREPGGLVYGDLTVFAVTEAGMEALGPTRTTEPEVP